MGATDRPSVWSRSGGLPRVVDGTLSTSILEGVKASGLMVFISKGLTIPFSTDIFSSKGRYFVSVNSKRVVNST